MSVASRCYLTRKVRIGMLILAGVLLAGAGWLERQRRAEREAERQSPSEQARLRFDARAAWLEAREAYAATTYWAAEKLAQACGHVVEDLWDALNAAPDKFAVPEALALDEIRLGHWDQLQRLPHGIEFTTSAGPGRTLNRAAWRRWLRGQRHAGWRLMQVEFRHLRFETNTVGQPWRSVFYFSAHLTNAHRPHRAEAVGDLLIEWAPLPGKSPPARVSRVDASRLTVKTRAGEPPFERVFLEEIEPPERRTPIDPVLLRDLDGDGFPEIALPTVNLVYRRVASGRYEPGPLCAEPPGPLFTAIIEDFNGDGAADLLIVNATGLMLYSGRAAAPGGSLEAEGHALPPGAPPTDASRSAGQPAAAGLASPAPRQAGKPAATGDEPTAPFSASPQPVWIADQPLKNPMALTCGDVDSDGALDIFFAQYRVPTLGTVLKPSYHDANDGDPAYLLLNDGTGWFRDVTEASGLAPKRWRRTYSASFADLDGDSHLDLLVVSDFAGAEAYRNDGRGHFTDVTAEWLGDAKGFGMAHTFADFNADGRPDFLMIGMPSPTVDRLEHLGLSRPGEAEDPQMRRRMASGNRLFLARPEGGFFQPPLDNNPLGRSGWSWGASAADFDNNGRPDVYVANGHQSSRSVREYEPEFWLHDLYVDDTIEASIAGAYLFRKFDRTRGQGWSYGGYEKNRLYLGGSDGGAVEVGHLFGVALEADSRNVVAEDLDGDGAVDLVVTTLEIWPRERHTLQIYRNRLALPGHWIGLRASGSGGTDLPVGTRVRVFAGGVSRIRQVVNGDSYRSQHSGRVHFGLDGASAVDRVEVRWPDGRQTVLEHPPINCWHALGPPAKTAEGH